MAKILNERLLKLSFVSCDLVIRGVVFLQGAFE